MNRLAEESSPYLRQHGQDPVDWFTWDDEAFETAKRMDRPVMVSIGYSACHWCHVMAHESFADPTTAELLNNTVVAVKVDREERPDIDAIYMEAVTASTGNGGWPMTVFLTPDQRPFFAGTYFPAEPTGNMVSFTDVVRSVDHAWKTQRGDIDAHATRLTSAIEARLATLSSANFAPDRAVLERAREQYVEWHDKEWGGFGSAPKFPQTAALELLMRNASDESMTVVKTSLDAMASGGIYDHLGGGFSRYSTDAFWMVPHFEKMLCDQALLARIYLHAFQITNELHYKAICTETIEYVLRDLHLKQGAFYTAEDADSEGEEGRFYIWRPDQIDAAIADEHISQLAKSWYGVTNSGNFEGSNILHRPERADLARTPELEIARTRLFDARTKRERPGLDDKILTEHNAMFIATLAEAGAALGNTQWMEDAEHGLAFLIDNLRDVSGRWRRSWHQRNGPQHMACAGDYAHLVDAFTRTAEATGKSKWRHEASQTANAMLDLFWDDNDGGLFTNGFDAASLIVNTKDFADGATPGANAVAAIALQRLGRLVANSVYSQRAEQIVACCGVHLEHLPMSYPTLLGALDLLTNPGTETVVVGDHDHIVRAVQSQYSWRNTLLWGERDENPLWEGKTDGAYVCRANTCGPARKTPEDVIADLK